MDVPDPTTVGAAAPSEPDAGPRVGPGRSSRLLPVASGVGLCGCLLLGVLGVRADLRRGDDWSPAVVELVREVELQRGSRFLRPVRIEQTSPQEVRRVRTERSRREAMAAALPPGVAAALGLVGPGDGDADGGVSAGALTLTAVYDPDTSRVLTTTPVEELTDGGAARRLLAGELTRALLEQVAPAEEPADGSPDPTAAFVRGVLVAGEVRRVTARLTSSTGTVAPSDAGGLDRIGGDLGEPLVLALATQGGLDLVDERLRTPPASTASVLSPYHATPTSATPASATAPPGPADPSRDEKPMTLGPLPWFLALSTAVDPVAALRAVDGRLTDEVVLRERDGRRCIDGTVTVDPAQTAGARVAFSAWVAAAPADRRLDDDSGTDPASLRVVACPPVDERSVDQAGTAPASGPDATTRADRLDTALADAAAASWATLSGVVDHGLAPATARCGALAAIERVARDQLGDRTLIGRLAATEATSNCP